MLSLIELLHQAQKEMSCPSCGRTFLLSEIRPRGRVKNNIMLQAVCANNHFPIVLIFIPSKPLDVQIKPLTNKEAVSLESAMVNFDGNFAKLWKK